MKHSRIERLKLTRDAEAIRDTLTLEEKISLMSGNIPLCEMKKYAAYYNGGIYSVLDVFEAGGIKEKNIPSVRLCDGTRGIVGIKDSTCFPSTMSRGATFDKELEKKIGYALGKETKARGGNLFAGICIKRPYKELLGFHRIHLEAGEEKTIHFTFNIDVMAFKNKNNQWVCEKGVFQFFFAKDSDDEEICIDYTLKEDLIIDAGKRSFFAEVE